MMTATIKSSKALSKQHGFTLIEVMIVVAIIGILAAIAYPNYQHYVIKSKRTDMMSEMHNIASQIQSRKLVQSSYSNALITGLDGDYPKQGNALYTISFTPNPLTSEWRIIAHPNPNSQMAKDGDLTFNYQGIKCRIRIKGADEKCGNGEEWNE